MLHYCRKISLLVFLLFIVSRADAQKTPLEFNDYVASITDSLNTYGRAWGAGVKTAFEENNYSKLAVRRQYLEKYIDREVARLTKMKDIKNSKALREGMIAFLQFEKSTIVSSMKPFESANAGTSQEQKQKWIEELTAASSKEEAELAKVTAAQQAYAEANGFTLGAEPAEGE